MKEWGKTNLTVPTTFLWKAHAFPCKTFLLTVVSEYILLIVRCGILCFSFLDLEQTVTLLKCSCAVPISVNGMSNHFEKRKSIRALKIYKSCSFLSYFNILLFGTVLMIYVYKFSRLKSECGQIILSRWENQPRTNVGLCPKFLNICIILCTDRTTVLILGNLALSSAVEVVIRLLRYIFSSSVFWDCCGDKFGGEISWFQAKLINPCSNLP